MWAELQHLSDGELVEAVRRGESEAFDVLFRRHYADACDQAARFAGAEHAPDRVAEGFSRVYRALLMGNGPDTNFRGYLYTAVRNAHVDVVRRGRGEVPVEDLGADLPASDDVEDDVLSRLDATPIRRAFARLRPRWRTVLWHTVVLGESHEEVARRLDSNPNAIAVLSFRAREGLRQAYLAEHVSASDDKACRRLAPHLPRHVRGELTANRERAVDEHLESCPACRAAIADLTQINNNLGVILTPAVVLLLTPGVVGGAALKGVIVALVARVQDLGKGAAGAAAGATAAVAAVAMGFALTAGQDTGQPRGSAPGQSNHPPPTGSPVPPPAEPGDRAASAAPPPGPTGQPVPSPIDTVPQPPQPVETSPPPTGSPPVTPSTPPSSPPTQPTPTPAPAPPSITERGATGFGNNLLRYAQVVFDVAPAAADGVLVTIANARAVAVTSSGVRCPMRWPPGGDAVVECVVHDAHPETFPVTLHVGFADGTEPLTGRVEVTGAPQVVADEFTVTP